MPIHLVLKIRTVHFTNTVRTWAVRWFYFLRTEDMIARAHKEFLGNYLFYYSKNRSFVWYVALKNILDSPKKNSCLWRAIKNDF